MGPPGSGKGTQARLLTDEHGWVHLATGDLFRAHLAKGTALGKLAERQMSKGQYVPDEVTVGMVRERVGQIPRATRIVFDGFPRTVPQAAALDELLGEHGRMVGRVILFDVRRDLLLERLSARATCGACQTMYSLPTRAPRVPGVCDRCGGTVRATARADDSPEVVGERLEVYEEQTRPVVERYERAGKLRRVDGVGPVDEVRARVAEAIAA